ncbi:MAG: hypothetical protein JSS02_26775 [Planctomycetes bacterium]|nr:hypothetical protein [Planctomycetota bacterium]
MAQSLVIMQRRILLTLLLLAVVLVAWGAGFASFPLGVEGEWTWERVALTESWGFALAPLWIVGAVYVGFIWGGHRSLGRCGAIATAFWMAGLVVAGFAWLWVAQEAAPENFQLSKAPWVLYYRGSSGYFSEARDEAQDLPRYLRNYEAKMAQGDVLHIGTHPPGLVVVLRGLLAVCERSPQLVDWLAATEPASARLAFDELQQHSPLPKSHRATLWLAALLVQLAAALTVVPLFGLLRMTYPRPASWQAAAFWPTVPAVSLFLPKSDCLFPCMAMTILWFWVTGISNRSLWRCLAAGIWFWLGLSLSLAFLPVAFVCGVVAVWLAKFPSVEPMSDRQADGGESERSLAGSSRAWSVVFRRLCAPVLWVVIGFVGPTVIVWTCCDINLFQVWRWNFHNHAGFYQQFSRTYWKWLLVNPVELSVAVGLPLAVLTGWSVLTTVRRLPRAQAAPAAAWLLTMGILWLSGKNMGEAARLWVFLMPFPVWISGSVLYDWDMSNPEHCVLTGGRVGDRRPGLSNLVWVALAAQLLGTSLLVTRVVGFHVPGLPSAG